MDNLSTYVLPSLEYHLNIAEKPPVGKMMSGLKNSRNTKISNLAAPQMRNYVINPFQSENPQQKNYVLKMKRLDAECLISSSADTILLPNWQKQSYNLCISPIQSSTKSKHKEDLSFSEASGKYKSSLNDIRSSRGSSPERNPQKTQNNVSKFNKQEQQQNCLPEFLGAIASKRLLTSANR